MNTLVNNSDIHIFKFKDTYIFHNLFNNINIEIEIREINCGSVVKVYDTFTLKPLESRSIKFHFDGHFQIRRLNPSQDYGTFPIYDKTLESIITKTKLALCGCGCQDCDDCQEEGVICQNLLGLQALMTMYYGATVPKYRKYLDLIFKRLQCDINAEMLCQINTERIQGTSDSTLLIKKNIAYHYLAFYLLESFLSLDEDDAYEISKKFKYGEIYKCLRKLGIDPKEIVEEIMSGVKVKYWQFQNTVSDMNTVISAWTPTYLDTLPGIDERPLEDFEQGVTIPYTSIGRVGFALYKTDLLNFTLYDSLGNDVTDNFEVHHFASEETVVFVSKLPYSHSNIYFKFKKNIYA